MFILQFVSQSVSLLALQQIDLWCCRSYLAALPRARAWKKDLKKESHCRCCCFVYNFPDVSLKLEQFLPNRDKLVSYSLVLALVFWMIVSQISGGKQSKQQDQRPRAQTEAQEALSEHWAVLCRWQSAGTGCPEAAVSPPWGSPKPPDVALGTLQRVFLLGQRSQGPVPTSVILWWFCDSLKSGLSGGSVTSPLCTYTAFRS